MKRVVGLALTAGLGVVLAARPYDPFISRGVLREKPRMILIALATNLSLAYDAQTSGLYCAWRGSVQNGNTSYSHQGGGNRGATLYPTGNMVYKNAPGGPFSAGSAASSTDSRATSFSPKNETLVPVWSASSGQSKVDYRGYKINHAQETATLRYNLTVGTAVVRIEETPDVSGANLVRNFKLTGVPAGTSVALQLSGSGISGVTENWTATGAGKVEDRSGKKYFVQDKDGETVITGSWN